MTKVSLFASYAVQQQKKENIMSTRDHKDNLSSTGEELFIEAAAALFEDPGKIAMLLSPEEAAEFEELRRRATAATGTGYPAYPDEMSIAAEDNYDDNYQ